MLIFKTSGQTFESVIRNEKHAFPNCPKNWFRGETVLVSKNKQDIGSLGFGQTERGGQEERAKG